MNPDPSPTRTVVVAGGSGLIGRHLVRELRRRGDTVRLLVRRAATDPWETSWDPAAGRLDPAALEGIDALINVGGVGAGDRRWTRAYKETILRSRVGPTALLARTLSQLERPPSRFLQASAVGFYGDRADVLLDEGSSGGVGFLPDVVRAWEAAADPARAAGLPVVHLRTGVVLSRAGGAAARMLPLFRLGLGGRFGSGKQWWAWITLLDEIRAIMHLLDSTVTGPVNLVAPEPTRNADVTRTLAAALHRSAFCPVPAPALRIAIGGFASEVLDSKRVVPSVLLEDGFTHRHPTITDAADWLVS